MTLYRPVVDKYGRQAQSYDRRWNRLYGGTLLKACIEAVPWNQVERVLDVGCGTGTLEQQVLQNGKAPVQIVGVDASLAMLREAQSKLNGNGKAALSWNNALAESLPIRTGSMDAVICANSFHYYRHPALVLEEFHRVIKPKGFLIFADWCHDFLTNKIGQWALHMAHRTGIHRYGLIRCYGMEEFSSLLTGAGFQIEMAQSFKIDWSWGIMIFRAVA